MSNLIDQYQGIELGVKMASAAREQAHLVTPAYQLEVEGPSGGVVRLPVVGVGRIGGDLPGDEGNQAPKTGFVVDMRPLFDEDSSCKSHYGLVSFDQGKIQIDMAHGFLPQILPASRQALNDAGMSTAADMEPHESQRLNVPPKPAHCMIS